ncbi:MAG TPA: DUF4349 domain-containing protein [Flavobacterium sp.]|nr:DUF4349 domain-containing protein [Flavobacterium sp.]HPJ10958.1 DUF4349 domain-containing protein [Flavobacterium sp.]
MRTIMKPAWALLAATTLFISCKQGETASEEAAVATSSASESTAMGNAANAADTAKKFSDNRKFIRTADFRFKVTDVAKSTSDIEKTTTRFGGLVTHSNLESVISHRDETQFSQDSTLVTTRYTVESNLTIRVPNAQLDTVVRTIAKEVDFLDARVIKADDVSLQLLSNQLTQNRNSTQQRRIEKAIDSKGKKLSQIIDAEEALAGKNENYDQAKLSNLALKDQIAFSTVTLKIYQPETTRKELVASVVTPRPNIGLQLIESIKTGWYILESVLAFVVQLWSLALLAFLGFLVYRKTLRKTKPAL